MANNISNKEVAMLWYAPIYTNFSRALDRPRRKRKHKPKGPPPRIPDLLKLKQAGDRTDVWVEKNKKAKKLKVRQTLLQVHVLLPNDGFKYYNDGRKTVEVRVYADD